MVRRVAEGAARGMNYLHFGKPPVLHRDLKSANILLDDSYNAKVADFGLSRLKAQERSMTGNCGTVQWMAPEILSNESYAEPADVYSYGKHTILPLKLITLQNNVLTSFLLTIHHSPRNNSLGAPSSRMPVWRYEPYTMCSSSFKQRRKARNP